MRKKTTAKTEIKEVAAPTPEDIITTHVREFEEAQDAFQNAQKVEITGTLEERVMKRTNLAMAQVRVTKASTALEEAVKVAAGVAGEAA